MQAKKLSHPAMVKKVYLCNMRTTSLLYCASICVVFCLGLGSCNRTTNSQPQPQEENTNTDTPIEQQMRKAGMVDINEEDSAIAVHLVYATPYNFMGFKLYDGINKAFMLPQLAKKISNAKALLKEIRPDLNLLIYDAARPLSIQKKMWAKVKGTRKEIFVANPNKGYGMHNYGAAVDITLMDCTGKALSMGSEYDYFGPESCTTNEADLLRRQRITQRELENRLLLRRVMTQVGLRVCPTEWWHFSLMSISEAKRKLTLLK